MILNTVSKSSSIDQIKEVFFFTQGVIYSNSHLTIDFVSLKFLKEACQADCPKCKQKEFAK